MRSPPNRAWSTPARAIWPFSIPGATTRRRVRIVRVLPRGYDPIVGELRRSDPYDSSTIITCRRHATDYELLSFQSGGGDDWVDPRKKKKKKNSGICLISWSVVPFPRPPLGRPIGGKRRRTMLTRAIIKFELEQLESVRKLLFYSPAPIKPDQRIDR